MLKLLRPNYTWVVLYLLYWYYNGTVAGYAPVVNPESGSNTYSEADVLENPSANRSRHIRSSSASVMNSSTAGGFSRTAGKSSIVTLVLIVFTIILLIFSICNINLILPSFLHILTWYLDLYAIVWSWNIILFWLFKNILLKKRT